MNAWNVLRQLINPGVSIDSNIEAEGSQVVKFPISGVIEEQFNVACVNNDKETAIRCIEVMKKEHKYDNVILALEQYRKVFGEELCKIEKYIADVYFEKGDYKNAVQHYIYSKIKLATPEIERKIYECCRELIRAGGCGETPKYWYNLYYSLYSDEGKYISELKQNLN